MSNFNEKPAQLFIGKTIEKPGSDTLINFSASEPVFLFHLPRSLPGDFNDKPSLIRYNTKQVRAVKSA